jgi:streptogrisin C
MRWLFLVLLFFTSAGQAQTPLTRAQAVGEDALQYAAKFDVSVAEATRRLRVQEASVSATESIAREFAARLAGISIEHVPEYRIIVLLSGTEPVLPRMFDGVPIVFRTGAKATHSDAILALRRHLIDFRADLPNARGAGYDQRTGEIVLLVTSADARKFGLDAIKTRAEEVGGIPVRVVINELREANMSALGGGRVEGLNALSRRSLCTTAFVITNGETNAVTTAAHCPDQLTYVDPDGTTMELPMIGSWGAGYQDVQINGSPSSPSPLFYSNRGAGTLRRLVSWRNVASTRAGDFVCHYGESSGYSCALVELTDYAPPGTLCGGPCSPTWVTVRGPGCAGGDSGGPVFIGDVAFGIAKGVNRTADGRCLFYYYMSTDYLPAPWRLLTTAPSARRRDRP